MTENQITICALVVNTLALIFVLFQLHISKSSLGKTTRSLVLFEKLEMLRRLPQNNQVLTVIAAMERWISDLESINVELEMLLKDRNKDGLKNLGEAKGLSNPKGVVSENAYKYMPSWLQEIWMVSAQHYYCAKSAMYACFATADPSRFFDDVTISSRIQEATESISELKGLIDDLMPSAYLTSPASLSEKEFLG